MPLPAMLLALVSPADAAEFQIEGFYRARARAFDTRSLTRDASVNTEGAAAFVQHRLWLRPRVVLSDQVSLQMEFRGLDNVLWGTTPQTYDPFQQTIPNVFEYGLDAPGAEDGGLPLDFTLWRAWAEVHTDIGRFTVGRVPLHWGLGIWLNDGVSTNPTFSDFGDTTDRVMWEYLANEQLYVRAAVDVPVEGLLGADDDTTSVSGAVAWRTEDVTAGLLVQYDATGGGRTDPGDADPFGLFTVDLTGEASLGQLHAAVEGVGHFGSGALLNAGGTAFVPDQTLSAFGVAAEVSFDLEPWVGEIRGGFASGDGNTSAADTSRRSYAFDRDYSVGMFMFEQPLPLLRGTDTGIDEAEVRTGPRIANAIFVSPTIRRRLVDGLEAHVTYVTGRTAAGDQAGVTNDGATSPNGGYGHEGQIGLVYRGIDHVELDARGAFFVPGSVYTSTYNLFTGDATPSGRAYEATAFGVQLSGRIHF